MRRRFEEAVANMSQGMCLYDADDRLQLVNQQFCRIYNQPMSSLYIGMRFREMLRNSVAVGNYPGRSVDELWHARKAFIDRREPGTFLQELGDGRLITISHQPLQNGGWVATYEDITERRRAELQVKFMAQHDALTQMPNRVLFAERLGQAMQAALQGRPCALICLDLNDFKLVNDRLGHAAGDLLLRHVAQRLQAGLRADDIAARLGGDEFAILLSDIDAAGALTIAGRVGVAIRQQYDLGEFGPAQVGVSIGLACAPEQAIDPDALLCHADNALYVAKHGGLTDPHLHGTTVPTAASSRQPLRDSAGAMRDGLGTLRAAGSLVSDLRTALQAGHLHLHYQPICDCDSDGVVAHETLLRWVDPIRGTVPPAEFIPAAEDSGFIVTLSEWVLRRACAAATRWPGPARVSVNLSPLNFSQPDLVATVAAILQDTGLPSHRLIIEITGGILLDHSAAIQARVHGLRQLGIELWLDDFGTGYANFSTLAASPFTAIKISRCFLTEGLPGRDILAAMITLGHTCGLKVIAEGLETPAQRDLLRRLGCDWAQGDLLGIPAPAEAVAEAHRAKQLMAR